MAGACMGDIYRLKQHPQGWCPRRCPLQGWRQPAREATAGIERGCDSGTHDAVAGDHDAW
ncbi:hypothetical protein GW17_00041136 [Ensete ventricosum]|nr:hypothetical protein GW17_00041136 [Ensete ventricosum]RZR96127.1 hypothetical protein BHM03_00025095 [Ensete ventricosum]